jgi:hypothetical protein
MKTIAKVLLGSAIALTASLAAAQEQMPWSGPAGSPQAAADAAVLVMSVTRDIPKDQLKPTIQAADESEATILVSAPSPNAYNNDCRYSLVKKTGRNPFGWEIRNSACTQG